MIENLDADRLMAGPLGQWLEQQASARDEARKASNGRFAIALPALLALLVLGLVTGLLSIGFSGFVYMAIAMFAMVWAYKPRADAVQRVKVGINDAIAQAVGISYTATGEGGECYERCKSFGMFPGHNKRAFEDFWTGEVAGHSFRLFEAHLEQENRDSDGGSSTKTVFRGPILAFGFARRFHGTTLVVRDLQFKRFLGLGGQKETIKLDGRKLDAVALVDPDFEDIFDVYSDDQVEARYLVHPAYCERLVEVERAFAGKKLHALFSGGELTVVLESDNLFESGGMDASQDRAKLVQTIGQFSALARLASTLNEAPR
ncbi:MAG: DUF3137 domain-containing protein [Sphingomonadales bacterium]|nr:DUF3137 domain-containing protein [Sphingomonadales bacterium]MBD3775165.1 DUF3137 domain-containing protein [Paracoccaceae bacterium]